MSFRMKVYNTLVNRVPGIRERYQLNRNRYHGIKKIASWLYLVKLNVQYYILRNRKVGESTLLNPDKGKKIIEGSESAITRLPQPEELVRSIQNMDVISFDVFDTLVLRKLALPEDVFYITQRHLLYPDYKNLRKQEEWKSREKRFESTGDYEVSFEEIWESLAQSTGIDAQVGMETEWSDELSVCYANPYFLEVVSLLKQQGKRIVICSDMYLGKKRIRQLLLNCGYPEFDAYYISCDYRKSKNKGDLYELIRKDLGSELSYIQIGDNEFSDVCQAKKHGYNTFYYQNVQRAGKEYRAEDMDPIISTIYSGIVNGYLHNGRNCESPEFEFGFIYGGLFVTGYCQFIHEYVSRNEIDKILFLARDGEILEKVYRYMYPDESERCVYTYWSRLASTKLAADLLRTHYMERMIQHKIDQNYQLKDLFHTMEIEDMTLAFINAYPNERYSETSFVDSKLANHIQQFISEYWNAVCTHYQEESNEGKQYFQRILGDAHKAVAVDVGWVGSGAIILAKVLKERWNIDCDITGLLAGTCGGIGADYESTAMALADGKLKSYMFSAGENRDVWKIHDAAKGHNMIVELLLSSNQKSFRGFRKNEKNEYDFNETSEKIDAAEIQRGILKFAELFKDHPLGRFKISGRDAAAPIVLLYQNSGYINKILQASEIRPNIE